MGLTSLSQKVISKKLINLRCTNFLYEDLWAVIMDEKSCSLVISCWILNQKHFSINQDNNYREEIHTPHLLMYRLLDESDCFYVFQKVLFHYIELLLLYKFHLWGPRIWSPTPNCGFSFFIVSLFRIFCLKIFLSRKIPFIWFFSRAHFNCRTLSIVIHIQMIQPVPSNLDVHWFLD